MRTRSPTLILAVVAFGVFVAADDLTVVSTMLRQIIFDLEIPLPDELNRAAWIVNAYLIAYVVVMPFVGRLSDILGRRTVYIAALVLFLLGSIWVPFATSLNSFIVGRVITAVGGGAMVPVAMAVIGDIYPAEKRATALGTLGAIDTAGWVWGPLYGALLIRFLSWEWQFYLNIPLAILGIVLAWWALADLPQPQNRERIDWLGTALLTLSLLTLNIALLSGGDLQTSSSLTSFEQPTETNTTLYYVIAALSFVAFLLIEYWLGRKWNNQQSTKNNSALSTQHSYLSFLDAPPLIDLSLFRQRNFAPAIMINFLVGAVLIIAMVNVPLLVNVLEFDVQTAALVSGFLLSGMTVAMAIMSYVGGRQTEKRGYRAVTVVGLAFCALGLGLMGWTWTVDSAYGQMAWQLVLLGIGFGLVIAPIGTAVINAAPDAQIGIAASLVIVLRLMGMSVGLAALTAWGLGRFNSLRTQIELPKLPLSDPIYQQALTDGLTQLTVEVLTNTFAISALIVILALCFAFWLKPDE